jgi:hypothetical protein
MALTPAYDLLPSDDDDVAAHHTDSRLRVLLVDKDLEKRLKAIWDRYRSHERETGLHTLFLIYGVVQWYDEQTGDDPQFAPALLQAVNLQRKQVRGRYEYSLVPHDDGLQANVALAEKMRQHWGLEMPSLRVEETPESYFVRLEQVLAKGTRLKLRRFLTLAVLPFPQMVLWKDLTRPRGRMMAMPPIACCPRCWARRRCGESPARKNLMTLTHRNGPPKRLP